MEQTNPFNNTVSFPKQILLDFLCFIFPFLFQVILTLPVGPESVIAIWDCPLDILKALLAFMYQGKVQVVWDDLRGI